METKILCAARRRCAEDICAHEANRSRNCDVSQSDAVIEGMPVQMDGAGRDLQFPDPAAVVECILADDFQGGRKAEAVDR